MNLIDIDALVPRTKSQRSSDSLHPETDTFVNFPNVEPRIEWKKVNINYSKI